MTFREENPALFRAVNILKASGGILYQKYNPQEYAQLEGAVDEVNRILDPDDCYLWLSRDFQLACIRFNDEEGTGYTNRLRARFTVNDMKLYVCLDRIYSKQYLIQGPYVTTSIEDIADMFGELGLTVGGRKDVSKRQLTPLLQNMARFSLLSWSRDEDDVIINPGIRFGIDRESFRRLYTDVIEDWLKGADNES